MGPAGPEQLHVPLPPAPCHWCLSGKKVFLKGVGLSSGRRTGPGGSSGPGDPRRVWAEREVDRLSFSFCFIFFLPSRTCARGEGRATLTESPVGRPAQPGCSHSPPRPSPSPRWPSVPACPPGGQPDAGPREGPSAQHPGCFPSFLCTSSPPWEEPPVLTFPRLSLYHLPISPHAWPEALGPSQLATAPHSLGRIPSTSPWAPRPSPGWIPVPNPGHSRGSHVGCREHPSRFHLDHKCADRGGWSRPTTQRKVPTQPCRGHHMQSPLTCAPAGGQDGATQAPCEQLGHENSGPGSAEKGAEAGPRPQPGQPSRMVEEGPCPVDLGPPAFPLPFPGGHTPGGTEELGEVGGGRYPQRAGRPKAAQVGATVTLSAESGISAGSLLSLTYRGWDEGANSV